MQAPGISVAPFDADRIFGAIFGAAIGDAVGALTKGKDRKVLRQRYPPDGAVFALRPTDETKRDWAFPTDQIVLAMRTMVEAKGVPSAGTPVAIARRLISWSNSGFVELGDKAGEACDSLTWRVLRDAAYMENPSAAAKAVLGPKATNGALTRIIPCAFVNSPADWAMDMSQVTHTDPRCIACGIAFVSMVRTMARQPAGVPVKPPALIVAIERGTQAAAELTPPMRTDILARATRSKNLDEIGLDDRDGRWFVSRTFACIVWAFRQLMRAQRPEPGVLFEHCIRQVAARGGDADVNCAAVGALIGAAIGYSALPKGILDAMKNKMWLAKEIAAFTGIVPLAPSGLPAVADKEDPLDMVYPVQTTVEAIPTERPAPLASGFVDPATLP